jgi:hypothetical protein
MEETTTQLKLALRLAPSQGEPDHQLLDDLIRLVKQAVVTSPKQLSAEGEFHRPNDEEKKTVLSSETKIKHNIEQASADSRPLVEQRALLTQQPDAAEKLSEESLAKSQKVISAIHTAMLRGINISIPDNVQ